MTRAERTIIVVPCYNEAARLDRGAFGAYAAAHRDVSFLFVDDGSTDDTTRVLQDLAAADPAAFRVFSLDRNRGKAEAVRRGVCHALDAAPAYVGYWDADLATPLDVLEEFIRVLDERAAVDVVTGARVRLLGRHIHRRPARHYLGRIFATVTSVLLRLPVYDTQCGAKVFRANARTRELFATPFSVRWTFDVEILARMLRQRGAGGAAEMQAAVHEFPLTHWRDVDGSKLKARDFVRAAAEIGKIGYLYRHGG